MIIFRNVSFELFACELGSAQRVCWPSSLYSQCLQSTVSSDSAVTGRAGTEADTLANTDRADMIIDLKKWLDKLSQHFAIWQSISNLCLNNSKT